MQKRVNTAALAASEHRDEPLRDPLTGLPGNIFFEIEGAKDLAFAKRHCTDMALLYFRIDSIAGIRSRRGRVAADRTVQRFVDTLRASIRTEDTIARLGDAQFGVIARQTGALGARLITQRTLRRVNQTRAEIGEDRLPISIGLASPRPYQIDSFENYIKLAVNCLQTAVEGGGDRVVAARSEEGLQKLKPRALSNDPGVHCFEPEPEPAAAPDPSGNPVVFGFKPRADLTMWLVEEGFVDQLDPDLALVQSESPQIDEEIVLQSPYSQVG